PASQLSGAERAKVDEVFAAFTKAPSPGCALAVYRDGEIAYARGYGLASLEHSVPITPTTVFDIGSTSKQFTAFSILLLERDGRLSLDDEVQRFIPELPRYQRPVTVRHLLQHTSGLRDYLTLFELAGVKTESWTTQQDAVRLSVRQREANFAAGDEWLYSNTGYLLLAEIVQRASGKSLKDFARERIFDPLGMAHTFFLDDHRLVVPERATGYDPRKAGGFQVDMSNFEQIGDGAVQTTVEDLLLWDRNFYAPKVGDAALLERAQQVGALANGQALDYAAGLMIGEHRGLRTVRHGGSWAGYRADLLRFPTEHTSVACLCNLSSADPSGLADRVADVVLAGKLKPAAATASAAAPVLKLTEQELRRYEGVYRSADGRQLARVQVAEGKATWRGELVMNAVAPDRFRLGEWGIEIAFTAGGPGGQECVVAPPPGSRARPVTFQRLPPVPGIDDLGDYAGDYSSAELDAVWTFSVKDGRLVPSIRGEAGEPLTRADRDTFFDDGGVIVEFRRQADGVSGARVHAGRVRNVLFERAR
ncbi:MAG: beta-lactamase, partial [Acidobacteria bacterium]|nr:beta-lactamase [Acidobacteriota bacterium]